ncbi:sugar phosphate isomerase/epimerase family protein [Arachidicoccus terrestris]|uniref:sugar phosphate isomerase/epimerase family protein n=1 Tax=Arachidicoccus terrestris TaxID=2875539 RepID=UPI001CC7B6C2|nr:sugar phosphate isomerase/epimerase [Arachidicoccus terrestris]UAY56897.1 sugar phosphate isomerase/epimerase [Arachidicoccus terrestris]
MSSENNGENKLQRREFLRKSVLASVALIAAGKYAGAQSLFLPARPNSKFHGVQIGVITYSYRNMPGDIKQILKYVVDSGISAIELMGDAVEDYAGKPADRKKVAEWRASVGMAKFEEVRKMFSKAGVKIYAFKPNALGKRNTDAEIDYAMKATKALGADAVTVELPSDPAQSERLGKFGEKHKLFVGYHAHTQATDTAWDIALSQSPYNTMNLDCGHYIASGNGNTAESLLALIKNKHDRITSLHVKDRKTKADGGQNMPWGEGDTPIKGILNLIRKNRYKFPATIELEYKIPDGSDAVQEVRKCLAYAEKALS